MTDEEYHDTLVRIAAGAEIAVDQWEQNGQVGMWTLGELKKDLAAWKTELDRRLAPAGAQLGGKREGMA